MTKKKIARSKPKTKGEPVDAEIRRAAERAGIRREVAVLVPLEELKRFDSLLAEAQSAAIEAAPREVPWTGGGTEAAVRAYDRIRFVRRDIAQLLDLSAGGAS